jgi:hypothetical protein
MIQVRYRTQEIRAALEAVAQHYFSDSLALDFQPSAGLSDPITEIERDDRTIPDDRHIRQFGTENRPEVPMPIIVEILPPLS